MYCDKVEMFMNIKESVSRDVVKKIFGNKNNARLFLGELGIAIKNSVSANEAYDVIVQEWDFEKALPVVRNLFTQTEKYHQGFGAYDSMNYLMQEWEKMGLGKITWPFSQGDFDGFVQRINSESSDSSTKDEKVKKASIRYRRIKEINTVRNDFIETLIFLKNDIIMPTLSHKRGVDFFIDGEQFDQKVSASPTRQFMKDFGKGEDYVKSNFIVKDQGREKWKQVAIDNPEIVAQYLYTYQDEGRFGADSRLLVVYLDENVSAEKIKRIIDSTDLVNPMQVRFEYRHKDHGVRQYTVKCFVILLYN